jgi:hypothetical protein
MRGDRAVAAQQNDPGRCWEGYLPVASSPSRAQPDPKGGTRRGKARRVGRRSATDRRLMSRLRHRIQPFAGGWSAEGSSSAATRRVLSAAEERDRHPHPRPSWSVAVAGHGAVGTGGSRRWYARHHRLRMGNFVAIVRPGTVLGSPTWYSVPAIG